MKSIEVIKKGKHFQIYAMRLNGITHYFVGRIEDGVPLIHGGTVWTYLNKEQAEGIFERAENVADNLDLFWRGN